MNKIKEFIGLLWDLFESGGYITYMPDDDGIRVIDGRPYVLYVSAVTDEEIYNTYKYWYKVIGPNELGWPHGTCFCFDHVNGFDPCHIRVLEYPNIEIRINL